MLSRSSVEEIVGEGLDFSSVAPARAGTSDARRRWRNDDVKGAEGAGLDDDAAEEHDAVAVASAALVVRIVDAWNIVTFRVV